MPDVDGALLLEFRDISTMRRERRVLDGINLTIAEGKHTAILGPNGSGKSTLIGLISRELYPIDGRQVRVLGQELWRLTDLRKLIGIVSPAVHADFTGRDGGTLRVFDAVASAFFAARGLWHNHALTDDMRDQTSAALARIGALHLLDRDMATLSSGEARRVLIARALVHQPRALILDEPCQGLDPATRRHFLQDLQVIARSGTTLILVTHHVEEILPEVRQIAMIRDGRMLRCGRKQDLLTRQSLSELFGANVDLSEHDGWYWPRFH
jgi:iron complex transport system ATP-binding protein